MRPIFTVLALLAGSGLCAELSHAADLTAGVQLNGEIAGDPPGFAGFFFNAQDTSGLVRADIQVFEQAAARGGVARSAASALVLRARAGLSQPDDLTYTVVDGNLNNSRNLRSAGAVALLGDTVTASTTYTDAPSLYFDRTVSGTLQRYTDAGYRNLVQTYVGAAGFAGTRIDTLSSVRVNASLTVTFENLANPDDNYSFEAGSTVFYAAGAVFDAGAPANGSLSVLSSGQRYNYTRYSIGDGAGGVTESTAQDQPNGIEGEFINNPLTRSANEAGASFTFRAGQQYAFSLFLSCNVDVVNTPAGTLGDCSADRSGYWNGLAQAATAGDFSLLGLSGVDYRYSSPLSPSPIALAVPEPGSAALLAVGLLLIVAMRHGARSRA